MATTLGAPQPITHWVVDTSACKLGHDDTSRIGFRSLEAAANYCDDCNQHIGPYFYVKTV